MRRTRSNSCAGVTSGGRRSLRNTHDHFDGIPNKIRNRMPLPDNKSDINKLSATRRSVRLSGGNSEMLQLGSRTRKRRLQSFGSPDRSIQRRNTLESSNGPKSPKVENLLELKDAVSRTVPLENGICSRTRRKFESLNQKLSKDALSTSSIPSPQKSSSTSPTSVQKQSRFSPKHSKSSPTGNCTNGGSPQSETTELDKLDNDMLNLKQLNSPVDSITPASQKSDSSDSEKLNNCQCAEGCNTHSSKENNVRCELCGKERPAKAGKNGSVVNGSLDSKAVNPRNLRSSGRPTAISFMNNSGSPIAGEEAGGKEEISVDTENLDHIAKNIQDSKSGSEQSDQDRIGHETTERVESMHEKLTQNSQSSITAENNCNGSTLQGCQTGDHDNQDVQSESTEVQANDTENSDRDLIEKPSLNGFSSGIMDEFSHVDLDLLSDGEECLSYSKKKRKMNLRSSGVRCDPDFYTLSLDLMIKRPRLKSSIFKNEEDGRPIVTENGEEFSDQDVVITDVERLSRQDSADKTESQLPMESDSKQSNAVKNSAISREVVDSTTSLPCTSSTPLRQPCQKIQPRRGRNLMESHSTTKLQRSPNIRMMLKDPNEPPPLFTEEPPTGPDVYYFESDHVALKHNRDYHNLLHTVTILESQRHQCLRDLEMLDAKKCEAMLDPIAFVEKLQSNEQSGYPVRQNVPNLPGIEWQKYSSVYGTFDHVFSSEVMSSPKKPVTRKVKINFEPTKNSKDKSKNQGPRPQSFGLPWSVEEQRKLEELLVKYPSEENESSRYRKVAKELGSRTASQVQSRVQKYFIKLAKAGLPVPGTMPKLDKFKGRTGSRARPHPHHHLTKLSTFFPTFHCPVKMRDDEPNTLISNDDEDGFTIDQDQVSDEEDVADEMRYSDEYLEILRLKRIRRERLRVFDKNGEQALAQHVGYECDMCNSDPIQGVRYHCIDCPSEEGVDLCQSCIRWQGQFETDKHKASHRMEPVYKAENFVDDDYLKFVSRSGEYNYLDPNFFPPKT